MSSKAPGIIIALFMLCVAHVVAGQDLNSKITSPATAPVITGTASAERVRFTAPSSVAQMQLQIYAESGQLLFDVTSKGNVLDWTLQDSGGQHLAPGSYLCVVTVKSLSGKLTQCIGSASVQEKQVGLQRAEPAQLTLAQQQAVGPIEENGALTILIAEETPATTVLANNGTEGQMIRSRGALTFRLGNFFSGKDQEQMRLTEEGNLGIGTTTPQAKLDVEGTIRAERFLIAKPGTSGGGKTMAATATTDATDSLQPLVGGAGTTGRLTKWTDGPSGTLGDSVITETPAGNLGVGTTNPQGALHVRAGFNKNIWFRDAGPTQKAQIMSVADDNGTINTLSLDAAPLILNSQSGGNVGIGTASPQVTLHVHAGVNKNIWFRDAGPAQKAQIMSVADDNGTINTLSLDAAPLILNSQSSGNVGIGTTNPASKLDVTGNINTSTQYNLAGNRMLSSDGDFGDVFVGFGAGQNNNPDPDEGGGANTFVGYTAGQSNTVGGGNSFFGTKAGFSNTGAGVNSFFGASAGYHTAGYGNSFYGAYVGLSNTTGNSNTLMGYFADVGANNLTNATAIGAFATVSRSNSLVLGGLTDMNVGIGTSAPLNVLHVNGNRSDFALTLTNQANTAGKRGYRIAFDNDRLTFQRADDSGNFAANQMAIDQATGNVGIGTTVPNAKLQVAGGSLYVTNPNGVIISSPNGICWLIGVSNAGALTTIAVPCP